MKKLFAAFITIFFTMTLLATQTVTVNNNGLVVSPSTFWTSNSTSVKSIVGLSSTITNSTKVNVVFIGSSSTQEVPNNNFPGYSTYPPYLRQLWTNNIGDWHNQASGGWNLATSFSPSQISTIVGYVHPDMINLAICFIGGNDWGWGLITPTDPTVFTNNYQTALMTLRAAGYKIAVLTITDRVGNFDPANPTSGPSNMYGTNTTIEPNRAALNAGIRKMPQMGAVDFLIDMDAFEPDMSTNTITSHVPNFLTFDQTHPNTNGAIWQAYVINTNIVFTLQMPTTLGPICFSKLISDDWGDVSAKVVPPSFGVIMPSINPVAATFSGNYGGPFVPSTITATLYTRGSPTTMDWSVASSPTWITISPTSGILAGNSSTNISVTTAAAANTLPIGVNYGIVVFTNVSRSLSTTYPVTNTVIGVSASLSTVSASPISIAADGAATSTITVTVNNTSGSPVSGKTVTLVKTTGPGTPTIGAASGTSDGSGHVTFVISSTTAGVDVFTATDSTDSVTITQTATITFTSSGDADVVSFWTRSGITDATNRLAVSNLVYNAKSHQWWDLCDAIYPFVGSNSTSCAQNLKSSNYTITWIGCTFDGNGVHGNGTSDYGDTGFNPTTAVNPNLVVNKAFLFVYPGTGYNFTPYAGMIGARVNGTTDWFYVRSGGSGNFGGGHRIFSNTGTALVGVDTLGVGPVLVCRNDNLVGNVYYYGAYDATTSSFVEHPEFVDSGLTQNLLNGNISVMSASTFLNGGAITYITGPLYSAAFGAAIPYQASTSTYPGTASFLADWRIFQAAVGRIP